MNLLELAQLGGTVATVGMFLWYLMQRNAKQERAMKDVTDRLEKVHQAQETHTRVLMKVADEHGLDGDADNLMKNKL